MNNISSEDLEIIIKDRMAQMKRGQLIICFSQDGSITQVTDKSDMNTGDIRREIIRIKLKPKNTGKKYTIKKGLKSESEAERIENMPEKNIKRIKEPIQEEITEKSESENGRTEAM